MGYVNKTYLSTQFKNFADKIAKVFSKIGHTHVKSDITDFPTSMPANGGNAATVGGHTVGVNVPADAKFTDTTYTSKTAVSGGTDVSLVTTGEKATWNAKTSNIGTVTSIKLGTVSYTPSSGIISLPAYPTTLPANGGAADKVGHTLSIGVVKGAANLYTFDGSSDVSLDIQIPTTASEVGALPISGGTITGEILSKTTSTSLKLTENAELICDTESKGTLTIKDSQINFSGRNGSGVLTSNYLEFFSTGTTATYSNNSITKKVGNDTYTLSLPSKTGTLALTSDIVDTNTWRPLGTGAEDACAGNDARLSDARPASDVYAWAKAASKPSYTAAEVGAISTSASCNKNWYWSGQSGQPSWLWGGNDGSNMYVYNPSNFSVNYANTAGAVTNLGTVYSRDTSTTYSLTGSGQWISLASVTLPAGVYVGGCWCKISGTPQSRMVLIFSNSNSATDAGAYHISDDNMDRACCNAPIGLNLGSQTTLYLRCYTSLGSTRAIKHGWYIIRIK